MREGEEENEIDLLLEIDSEEETGAEITIPVKSIDISKFSNKIREQLCYFSDVVIKDEYSYFDNGFQIFQTDDFKWSSLCKEKTMHICLADVYYPIDWSKLGIEPIHIPVGLKFSLDDGIEPLPARESFKYLDNTKEIILEKIKKVANWFVEHYNESSKEFDNILEAYDLIDRQYRIYKIYDREFIIDDIIQYSEVPVKDITVKGIKLMSLKKHKQNLHEIFYSYNKVAYITPANRFKTSKLYTDPVATIRYKHPVVILDRASLSGYYKEYLKEKYGEESLFIRKDNDKIRKLRNKYSTSDYYTILNLGRIDKTLWRDYIKEFQYVQESIINLCSIEMDTELTDDYIDWLAEAKADKKKKRENKPSSSIRREQGEIIINYAREHVHTHAVVFQKTILKLDSLSKKPYLTVMSTEEDRKSLEELFNLTKNKKIKVAIVAGREQKKIKSHNFTTFIKFMTEGSKPFRRIASAIKISKFLTENEELTDNHPIIKEITESLNNDIIKLREYMNTNSERYMSKNLADAIIKIADENNFYDLDIMALFYEVKSKIEKLEFIALVRIPNDWDDEAKSQYRRLITQMLLFRKLKYNEFDDYELVKKEVVEEIEEELELEEQLDITI